MADLVADQVDIIVPIATPTAVVAQSATEDNQIPVVFSAVSDPVTAGLVKSMDKPGSNITGVSDALNTDAFMKMITTAKTVKKIGFLYDKSQDSSTKAIKDAKGMLESGKLTYEEIAKIAELTIDEVRALDKKVTA